MADIHAACAAGFWHGAVPQQALDRFKGIQNLKTDVSTSVRMSPAALSMAVSSLDAADAILDVRI